MRRRGNAGTRGSDVVESSVHDDSLIRARAVVLGSAMCFLACAPDRSPAGATAPVPSAQTAVAQAPATQEQDGGSAPEEASLVERLSHVSVTDDDFARSVFYTWTSIEQIAALRAGGPVLSRSESPKTGPSMFDQTLDRLRSAPVPAARSDGGTTGAAADEKTDRAVASLLRGGKRGLSFRRFAWVTPWPTRIPLGGVSYGDHLLRLELRPGSVVARFEARGNPRWRFLSTEGTPVPVSEVLSHPERLAAILHVAANVENNTTYREYVLCNESRIERAAYGTDDVQETLAEGAALLRAMAKEAQTPWPAVSPFSAWAERYTAKALPAAYMASLAFPHVEGYAPSFAHFENLANDLDHARTLQRHPPLVLKPNVSFEAQPRPVPNLKDRVIRPT